MRSLCDMCGVRDDSDSTINYIDSLLYSQEKKCIWMDAAVAMMNRCVYVCSNQLGAGANATCSLLWLSSGCCTVVRPIIYGGVRSDVIQRPVCVNHA
jgi:hypothetical protein